MKMQYSLLLGGFLFLILCSSCQEIATLYLPTSVSHNLLTEKGDNLVSAGIKSSDTGITSGEFQATYLPIQKLSVAGNFSYANKSVDDFEKRKLFFGELALGTNFQKEISPTLSSVFELSAGFGLGDVTDFRSNNFDDGTGTIVVEDRFYAKSRRIAGQVNWGLRYKNPNTKLQFQFGPSLRFSNINIHDIAHISNQRSLELASPKFQVLDWGNNFSIGYKNIHFFTQILVSIPVSDGGNRFYDDYVDSNDGHFSGVIGVKAGFGK